MNSNANPKSEVSGEFVDMNGERFYAIRNVDKLDPFFTSIISNTDHWLFVSSTGGLTAGRVSPETALFPYVTVDKIHESTSHTGCKTLFRVIKEGSVMLWEPYNAEHDGRYRVSRHLYKNFLGNKLCFEELNHDLKLAFRYTWSTSEPYGFVRDCEVENLSDVPVELAVLDGLQNVLPAGTPRFTQTNSSNLVDAYKWTELEQKTGLAMFTLFSGITDRAEPAESLKANTVFCLGLSNKQVLLSNEQVGCFRSGSALKTETVKRGIRGAYLVYAQTELAAQAKEKWTFVANTEQTQKQVVGVIRELSQPEKLQQTVVKSVEEGSDKLARIMASSDGFQATAEENVDLHHYANVVFNVLRGGIFDDQYRIDADDFRKTIRHFNQHVYQRNSEMLNGLSSQIEYKDLIAKVQEAGDLQLERLCGEYLPITFGRRHGDPSRPWNQFAIKLKDEHGNRLLSYQGNWRDIFQNWEALTFSYPEFIESVIAKFVNASTMDGYNPYRITKEGIDWEVEEPDDPWSYIGYWGDHQIIYLLKLLELSNGFHPDKLAEMLFRPVFCYANVPYRIKPFEALLEDAKDTVEYDETLAEKIDQRVSEIGADGKLVLDSDGQVYQVNLIEKLLVPLLTKLSNLVVEGGIWLNTQRPEWNDANNALVGQGLSMVTLYYMRRYINFMLPLIEKAQFQEVSLSTEVIDWLADTTQALAKLSELVRGEQVSDDQRFEAMVRLGRAGSDYRQKLYKAEGFSGKGEQALADVSTMLRDALEVVDQSIASNRRNDGLYHAYNLLTVGEEKANVSYLYPMLEGQVAMLSSGAASPEKAVEVIETLFESAIYRPDQETFMLYPDRDLPGFLDKNILPNEAVEGSSLLSEMVASNDERLVSKDANGVYRFSAELTNAGDLAALLDQLKADYSNKIDAEASDILALYERVFNHQAFTGRSGGMFGFEGLGCIYWHMVSKLLLAVQENFFAAVDQQADVATCRRLGELYYQVRKGIGFNKTPEEYGAFPMDPYSHTPKHAGAQQPGMTGQVKEEVLTRFGELGIRVSNGITEFKPVLLRDCEFVEKPSTLRYLDVQGDWQDLEIPAHSIAFTWCQVPFIYELDEAKAPSLTVHYAEGTQASTDRQVLDGENSKKIFERTGQVQLVRLTFNRKQIFSGLA